MQTRGSKFVRFQEMKLQERAIEVCRLIRTLDTQIFSIHAHRMPYSPPNFSIQKFPK